MKIRQKHLLGVLLVCGWPQAAADDESYARWSLALELPRGPTIEYRLGAAAAVGIYSIGSDESYGASAYYDHPGYNYEETVYGIRYAHLFGDGNHRAEFNLSVQAERHRLRYHNGESRSSFEYGYGVGMGYRYEPVDDGFQFRAGLLLMHELNDVRLDEGVTPFFEDLFEEGAWPYLSVGWSF